MFLPLKHFFWIHSFKLVAVIFICVIIWFEFDDRSFFFLSQLAQSTIIFQRFWELGWRDLVPIKEKMLGSQMGLLPEREQVIGYLERGTAITKYCYKSKPEKKAMLVRRYCFSNLEYSSSFTSPLYFKVSKLFNSLNF